MTVLIGFWITVIMNRIESVKCPGYYISNDNTCNGLFLREAAKPIVSTYEVSQPLHDATPSYGGTLHTITSNSCPAPTYLTLDVAANNGNNKPLLTSGFNSGSTWRIDEV